MFLQVPEKVLPPSTSEIPAQPLSDVQKPAKTKKFVPKLADFMPTKGMPKVCEMCRVSQIYNEPLGGQV